MKRRNPNPPLAISTLLSLESIALPEDASKRMAFTAGRGFDPGQMVDAPAVLVPVFGVPSSSLDSLLKTLYRVQTISMGFRPIIFSDMDILAAVRPYGWVLEHHLSEYDHHRLGSDSAWDASVLHRARLIASFYGVRRVIVPDVSSGLRLFLRHLRELTQVEVGSPLPVERSETTTVSGWRAWLGDGQSRGSAYNVETYSGGTIGIEIEDGAGENVVVIDRSAPLPGFEHFVDEASSRAWPIVRVPNLNDLDEFELPMALESLLALGEPQGTMVLLASSAVAARVRAGFDHERMVLWAYDAGEDRSDRLSAADVEMTTTIRRASSALSTIV